MKMLSKDEVYEHITAERNYQDMKWGADKAQSLPGYLIIMQKELQEAIDGWMKNDTGRNAPLHEVLQVAAVAVACLEQYGVHGSTINTLDIPFSNKQDS